MLRSVMLRSVWVKHRRRADESLRQCFAPRVKVSAQTIAKLCLSVLVLMAGAALNPPRVRAQAEGGARPEGAQYLPAGAGREIVLSACVQCHDLRNTVSQRKIEQGWRRTVDEMVWRGTPLVGDEADVVTRYLAAAFGPDKPVPDEVKKIFAGEKGEKAGEKKEGTP